MGEYVNAGGVRTYTRSTARASRSTFARWGRLQPSPGPCRSPRSPNATGSFVPERRGHGHTPDVVGPITYELMAADTAAFLEAAVTGARTCSGGATEPWWAC